MNKSKQITKILIIPIFILVLFFGALEKDTSSAFHSNNIWEYQCVDTMKYSRDTAREWAGRKDAKDLIEKQVSAVAETGANCIALGTPYDEEFFPVLKMWVDTAREYNLKIWFRGNMSSWENWFGYEKNTDTEHHNKGIYGFITSHSDIFKWGDIFTTAPEAENGFGNVWESEEKKKSLRAFLVSSYANCQKAAYDAGIYLDCGYFSANGDVAKSIFTKDMVKRTGGVVVVDHYVKTAERTINDLKDLNKKYDSKVFLGEFGAYIPDIHGKMTESEQADFVDSVLRELYKNREIVKGVNYWVLSGGTTALLNGDGSKREVFYILQKYYDQNVIYGTVKNMFGFSVSDVEVSLNNGEFITKTDKNGHYQVMTPDETTQIVFKKGAYKTKSDIVSFGSIKEISLSNYLFPDFGAILVNIFKF